jgi:hypothetical protein
MRILIAVIAIALLTVGAVAQGMGKGRRHQQDAPKTEEQAKKKKAADEAFQRAGKTIPESTAKADPWKGMR